MLIVEILSLGIVALFIFGMFTLESKNQLIMTIRNILAIILISISVISFVICVISLFNAFPPDKTIFLLGNQIPLVIIFMAAGALFLCTGIIGFIFKLK